MTEPTATATATEEPKVDVLGQLWVELEGVKYMLRPSRQAIANIERALGKSVTQLATQAGSFMLSVDELGVCVAELMNAYGRFDPSAPAAYKMAKPPRCAELVFEAGPVDVSGRIAVIFVGALSGGYTASGEPKAVGMTMPKTEQTPTAE
jgi:hypothetical protein